MTARSYGLVPFRRSPAGVEVLIGHLGGPFWTRKDVGAWSFPKGLPEGEEQPLQTARREFAEELGVAAPDDGYLELGEVRQSSKIVTAWAVELDLDPADVEPGTFELEWPPRSGRVQEFPEVDRVAWVDPDVARRLLVTAQRDFVDRLVQQLA